VGRILTGLRRSGARPHARGGPAHPEDNWAVVDIEDYSSEEPRSLLIIDIDLYKADDPDEGDGVEDVEEAVRKTGKPNGTPFAKSQSGGVHVYAWSLNPSGR